MKTRPFEHLDVEIDHTTYADGRQKFVIVIGKDDADDAQHYLLAALNDLDDYRMVQARARQPISDEGVSHESPTS